jgi:hypothetical protein
MTLGSTVGVKRAASTTAALSAVSPENEKAQVRGVCLGLAESALGGIRTPNLLIRSQMLYPLSYERWTTSSNDTWGRWV